jgi:hypothetical protein
MTISNFLVAKSLHECHNFMKNAKGIFNKNRFIERASSMEPTVNK